MQTIIVLLNPGMLENADLDLRYRIPDRIEEVSNSLIQWFSVTNWNCYSGKTSTQFSKSSVSFSEIYI